MANKINYECKYFMEYEVDDKKGKIRMVDLKPYINNNFHKTDIEKLSSRIYNDKILFSFTGYSGQYGIVGVWDTNEKN